MSEAGGWSECASPVCGREASPSPAPVQRRRLTVSDRPSLGPCPSPSHLDSPSTRAADIGSASAAAAETEPEASEEEVEELEGCTGPELCGCEWFILFLSAAFGRFSFKKQRRIIKYISSFTGALSEMFAFQACGSGRICDVRFHNNVDASAASPP